MDNPPPPSSLSPVLASPAGGTQRGTLLPCKGFRIVHILLDQEPSLERKPWSGYMWIWYQRTWIGILISPLSSCGILKSIFLCSYLFNGANNPCILIHVDITQDNVWKGSPDFCHKGSLHMDASFPLTCQIIKDSVERVRTMFVFTADLFDLENCHTT